MPAYLEAHASKINECISILQSNGRNVKKFIKKASRYDLGDGYYDFEYPKVTFGRLIAEAQIYTARDLRYGAPEYLEANRVYAETVYNQLTTIERSESNWPLNGSRLAIEEQELRNIGVSIDSIVGEQGLKNLVFYVKHKGESDDFEILVAGSFEKFLESFVAKHEAEIAQMADLDIRTTDTCAQQCQYIQGHFRSENTGLVLIDGYAVGSLPHTILVALPKDPELVKDLIGFDQYAMEELNPDINFEGFISRNAFTSPLCPDYRSLTIIDPTIMQFFNDSFHAPELVKETIPKEYANELLRSITPYITPRGVFIGPASEYIRLLCILGADSFPFSIPESSIKKINY